jgi:hypothetical protein
VRRRTRRALAVLVPLIAVATLLGATAAPEATGSPSAGTSGDDAGVSGRDDPLAGVRAATARYRNVDRAIDAGYVQFFGCVHEPLAGSMGIHFVHGSRAGDAVLEPTRPEALMYQEQDGRLVLAGVEYVVFQEAWEAEHDEPPVLFGRTLTLVPSPNRYGIPAFYELHAWSSTTNPTGAFEDWNPRVLCPGAEGHQH